MIYAGGSITMGRGSKGRKETDAVIPTKFLDAHVLPVDSARRKQQSCGQAGAIFSVRAVQKNGMVRRICKN
jgi:hypothetical protein